MRRNAAPQGKGPDRGRPRPWHHDYLHLRPIARDLEARLAEPSASDGPLRVLDAGCGPSPYRRLFPPSARYVRIDRAPEARPDAIARAEALPLAEGAFDVVLSTQSVQLADDPRACGAEIARVLRPGGKAFVTVPAAWPYDAARAEHRFGAPDLPALFPGLSVAEIVPQGGLLGFPFALVNLAVREVGLALRRRVGAAALAYDLAATIIYLVMNAAGRFLEALGRRGPLVALLSHLDRRLPVNFLVVLERPR